MGKNIHLRFVYVIEGAVASGNIDTYFYSHFPHVETQVIDKNTGRPVTDIPPVEQAVKVAGSTTVSSALAAGIIRDYLQSRERKITIAIEGIDKQVKYEGPNLKAGVTEIEEMIDKLNSEARGGYLVITATYLSSMYDDDIQAAENSGIK